MMASESVGHQAGEASTAGATGGDNAGASPTNAGVSTLSGGSSAGAEESALQHLNVSSGFSRARNY